MSSIDGCKLYERLASRFEGKLSRLSSKTNNFDDTKNDFVKDLYDKCE